MDDISDLVFVLAFVGYIIYKVISSARQIMLKAGTGELGDFMPENSRPVNDSPVDQMINRPKIHHHQTIEEIRNDIYLNEEDDTVKSAAIQKSEKHSTKNSSQVSLNSINEARRAFIYSEIWNRKY
ncbi:MAG: hypothetical protein M0P12_05095 [Paludibacteraceae bacterium]|nr:hypothetical protein [Paludibacteraceae bacterium]